MAAALPATIEAFQAESPHLFRIGELADFFFKIRQLRRPTSEKIDTELWIGIPKIGYLIEPDQVFSFVIAADGNAAGAIGFFQFQSPPGQHVGDFR